VSWKDRMGGLLRPSDSHSLQRAAVQNVRPSTATILSFWLPQLPPEDKAVATPVLRHTSV
jgi:hypothetical protein